MYASSGTRLFDILSVVAALIALWPLMLLVAVLIKLFDAGPVFFKQRRVGRYGATFLFYKFRSMPVSTRDIPSDKLGSIKLSWIGKLIRRTNVDELPQLFNILKGEMSVVGPRPPLPTQEELIALRKENGALQCRPGLTGLAQINSFNFMSVAQKAQFDGEYARDIRFRKDVQIILKTFFYLLKPPPVY
jgi:O-antigen biosynthesis protein WbqP